MMGEAQWRWRVCNDVQYPKVLSLATRIVWSITRLFWLRISLTRYVMWTQSDRNKMAAVCFHKLGEDIIRCRSEEFKVGQRDLRMAVEPLYKVSTIAVIEVKAGECTLRFEQREFGETEV
jgi:hypothetical protein